MILKEFKADLDPHSRRHNISTHKNVLSKLLVGNIVSDFKNKSVEFEDYREYTNQYDDASRIDWRASLKANQLLVRETIEEKSVNVLFMLDVSDTMLFSSGDKLKCEYAAEIISDLAWGIQREGNAIGICMFNEKIVRILEPKIGTGQYHNMLDELKNAKNYGGRCNLKNAVSQSIAVLKTPGIVVIISDFINMGEGWESFLEVISLRYDLLGLSIRDVRDRNIPKDLGYFVLEDPHSRQKILVDTKEFYPKFREQVEKEEEHIQSAFKKAKSGCLTLETNIDYFNPLIKFLQKRVRMRW